LARGIGGGTDRRVVELTRRSSSDSADDMLA
jgi:hypothetical protein